MKILNQGKKQQESLEEKVMKLALSPIAISHNITYN